jgi:hypothetical protein
VNLQQATINSYKDQEAKLSRLRAQVKKLNDENQERMQLESEDAKKAVEEHAKKTIMVEPAPDTLEERCQKELQEFREEKNAQKEEKSAWPKIAEGLKEEQKVKNGQDAKNVQDAKGGQSAKSGQDAKVSFFCDKLRVIFVVVG